MKTLDKKVFLELANYTGKNCISIYIPTHKAGQEVLERHDIVNFKNQIQKISADLASSGLKPNEIDKLLKPAVELLDNSDFWRQQSEGLAVFLTNGFFDYYKSPVRFEEFYLISQSFYVKPLIPMADKMKKFYLLKLSKHELNLFEATEFTIDPVDIHEIAPTTIREVTKFYDFEAELQGQGTAQVGTATAAHHRTDEQNPEKEHLLFEYFRKVNDSIVKLIGNQSVPLVIAGVEYYHFIYKKANTYPHLCKSGPTGSFDRTHPQELLKEAWPHVEPFYKKFEQNKASQFQDLSNTDRVSIDVGEIIKAAASGRVDTIFVSKNVNIWGKFDEQEQDVAVHHSYQQNDECLLNKASIKTLENGGQVYVSENGLSELNRDVPVAAIFRY
jgi:hypothetical protein